MAKQTKADLLSRISELETRLDQYKTECPYEEVLTRIPLGFYRSTHEGKIIEVNPAFISLLGFPDQESVLLRNAGELYADPEDRTKWQQIMLSEGAVKDFEVQWQGFGGEHIWVNESASAIQDADGNPLYFEGLVEDISEKKKAAQERESLFRQLQAAQQIAQAGSWEWDPVTDQSFFSEGLYRLLGIDPGADLPTRDAVLDLLHPEDRLEFIALIENSVDSGGFEYEGRIYRMDDHAERIIRARGVIEVDRQGNPVRLFGSAVDVTETRETGELLKRNEEKYRFVFEYSPLPLQSLDIDTRLIQVNPAWLETLGYSQDEVLGKNFCDFLHPDQHEVFRERFTRFIEEGKVSGVYYKLRHKSGEYRDVYYDGCVVHHPDGSFRHTYCIFRDVTEQLQHEREIEASNQKFNLLFNQSADAIVLVNSQSGKIVDCNRAFEELAGRSREGLLALDFWETRLSENRVQVKRIFEDILRSNKIEFARMNLTQQDGKIIPIELTGSVIEMDGVNMVQAGIRDISPRLAAEAEMRKAQTVIETIPDAVITTDPDGAIIYWNSAAEKMFGFKAEEAVGKPIQIIFKPEDFPLMEKIVSDAITEGQAASRELTCINKDKQEIQILLSVSSIKDHNGNIIELVGVTKDITELAQTRYELAASENKFRTSFEAADVGMALVSAEGNFLSINDSLCKTLNFTQIELLGSSMFDLLHPDDLDICTQDYLKNVDTGVSYNRECKFLTASGETVIFLTSVSPLHDLNGKFLYTVTHFQNITQRILVETELKEANRQLKTLFGNLPGMAYRCRNDENWTMELVSDGALALTGYHPEELVGNASVSYNQVIHPEDRQKVRDAVDSVIDEDSHFQITYRIITKAGEQRWVWEQGVCIQSPDKGGDDLLEGFIIDITDRIQAESALEESEQRFREIFESIRDGIAIYEAVNDGEDFIFKDINPAGARTGNKDRQDHIGRRVREVYPGVEPLGLFEVFKQVWKTGEPVHLPTVLYQDQQVSLWVENHVVKLPSGEIMTVYEDKTAEKMADAEREYRNQFIQIILDNMPIGLAVNYIDQGVASYMNAAFEKIYGWPMSELVNIEEFFKTVYPDEDYRNEIQARIMADIESGDLEKMAWEGIEITQKDGAKRLVAAKNIPIPDQNIMISTVQDITERSLAEQKLKNSEARLRRVIESTPLGMLFLTLNSEGALIVSEANSSASEVLGIDVAEKIGLTLEEAFPGLASTQIPDIYRRTAELGIPWHTDDLNYLDDDIEGNFEVFAFQIVEDSLAVMFHDITERKKSREQLKRQAILLETISDAVISADLEFTILTWNQAAEEMYGWKQAEVVGKEYQAVVHPEYLDQDRETVVKVFREEGYWEGEAIHTCKAGKRVYVHSSATRIKDLNGVNIGLVTVNRDITARKFFELEQKKSAERLRILHLVNSAILEAASPREIAATAADSLMTHLGCLRVGITTVDHAGEELTTLAVSDSPGEPDNQASVYVYDDYKKYIPLQYMNQIIQIESLDIEDENSQLLKGQGNERIVLVPMISKKSLIGSIILTFPQERELTEEDEAISTAIANQLAIAIEQAQLRKQIEDNWTRMQSLAQKVITAQEDERQKISREIHDEAGQSLTALKIDLELLKADIPEEQGNLLGSLEAAITLADEILESLRGLAQGLRPPSIDAIGLLSTLESMCANHELRTGMKVIFEKPDELLIPEDFRIILFRFQQEALTNITRYSKATRVQTTIEQDEYSVRISIKDNGVGFDPENAESAGMGLLSMRERLEIIGGYLEVESQPGQGTRLTGVIPVAQQNIEVGEDK